MLKNNLIRPSNLLFKSFPAPPPSLASIQDDSIINKSSVNDNKNSEDSEWDRIVTEENENMKPQNHNKPNLKLNLSRIAQSESVERVQSKNEYGSGFYSEPVGFHQEFMAKIDEFSLSWRQAAMKEKKL